MSQSAGAVAADAKPAKAKRGLPLAPQIVVLLLGGLVIAQLTTLCLTLALPPEPQAKYRLADVASALRGGALATDSPRPLVRTVRSEPPSTQSPGWMVSEQSRDDLARLTGAAPADVRLLYYSPLPFAGATGRKEDPSRVALLAGRPLYAGSITTLAMLLPGPVAGAAANGGNLPGGGFPGGGFPGGGFPGGGQAGGFPGGGFPGAGYPGGGFPGGGFPGGSTGNGGPGAGPASGGAGTRIPSASFPNAGFPADAIPIGPVTPRGDNPFSAILTPVTGRNPVTVQADLPPAQTAGGQTGSIQSTGGQYVGGQYVGGQGVGSIVRPPQTVSAPLALFRAMMPPMLLPAIGAPTPGGQRLPVSYRLPSAAADPAASPASRTPDRVKLAAEAPGNAPASVARAADPGAAPSAPDAHERTAQATDATGYVLPSEKDQPHGLFGAAPSPFVAGDFVAALRVGPGRWVVVQPQPEPFPNSWQRRIILWFLLSSAAVIPLGILFARRLAAPLGAFAEAAESLGKDPRALPAPAVSGTAEIARAAAALNQMQARLRRFIEDRTAMVGAISHDLRTPLARMRFRLERAPEDVRIGMLHDISQMEAMLSGVLAFIRDASEVTVRERIELRSLLECVVDNAALTGGDVVLDPGGRMPVDIDCLSVERVLTNLVDNALKYGDRAVVRVFEDGPDVIAEIEDEGPGLPPGEIERVFEPFYRSDHSRGLNKAGIGLGLAVSRSIARAHGGDVNLSPGERGLKAQLRLPKAKAA